MTLERVFFIHRWPNLFHISYTKQKVKSSIKTSANRMKDNYKVYEQGVSTTNIYFLSCSCKSFSTNEFSTKEKLNGYI